MVDVLRVTARMVEVVRAWCTSRSTYTDAVPAFSYMGAHADWRELNCAGVNFAF